jgi:hypothetical protein
LCKGLSLWRKRRSEGVAYLIQSNFEVLKLALLDHQVILIIQILDNIVVSLLIVLEDHGFD